MSGTEPFSGLARTRRAFTLLEVVVALAIGGLAVLTAAALLISVSDGVGVVQRATEEQDETANGERLLRRLIGQMAWTTESEPASVGDALGFRFASRCGVPMGWQERCQVEIRIRRPDEETPGVEVRTSIGEHFLILPGRDVRSLLYLESAEHGGRWRTRWTGSVSLPPAIGIVRDTDTLLIRTGDRG